MQELQIFNNPDFGEIRTLVIDNEPWFIGKDVATALGYSDTKSAVADHIDTEDKTLIQRGANRHLRNSEQRINHHQRIWPILPHSLQQTRIGKTLQTLGDSRGIANHS